MATKKTDDLIDRIVFAVGDCHDGPSLWDHMRQDPEAFRSAVRHVLINKQADAPDQCQDCGAEIIGAHGCQGVPGDENKEG